MKGQFCGGLTRVPVAAEGGRTLVGASWWLPALPVPCREQAGEEQRGRLPAAGEELHPAPPGEPGEPGAVPRAGHHRGTPAEGRELPQPPGSIPKSLPKPQNPPSLSPYHPGQVSGPLLDMSTLMASQILMEQVASEGSGLLLHLLYQHLLFDFRIWSNSDFAVRLGGGRRAPAGLPGARWWPLTPSPRRSHPVPGQRRQGPQAAHPQEVRGAVRPRLHPDLLRVSCCL